MDTVQLSLRQRQLINYLQNQRDFITGADLARALQVSPRTIRNDISEINAGLAGHGIQIISEKSKGYLLSSDGQQAAEALSRISHTFLTREDRVRYLAFSLCLSDIPLNIYDMEDEMYVSRTTLEQDIQVLKTRFVISSPHISLMQSRGFLEFEADERKRRTVLNHLFHEDWNYNARGNSYYSYQYLDDTTLDLIMSEASACMNRYDIQLEDTNMVTLNLAIAIMHHRIMTGHTLSESATLVKSDAAAEQAVRELLDALEAKLDCCFSPTERNEIYLHVACTRLMDASRLSFEAVNRYFTPDVLHLADAYLDLIRKTFRLDFTRDEDFYITLPQYIRYLQTPTHSFNKFQLPPDVVREQMMVEYEIAWLFQDLALKYLNYYLNETELMYLALCISGALEYLNKTIQDAKFKTIICCHLNLYATWAIKQKVLAAFDNYLDIVAIIPVNARTVYDFSKIDLVLTTVNKTITNCPTTKVMYISPFMTQNDYLSLEHYISQKRIRHLYAPSLPDTDMLLAQALRLDMPEGASLETVMNLLADALQRSGTVTDAYYKDLIRRESISTFAFRPGTILMYSLKGCVETKMVTASFAHRITWNSHKINQVIMVSVRPEDATLLFRLINDFYHSPQDIS